MQERSHICGSTRCDRQTSHLPLHHFSVVNTAFQFFGNCSGCRVDFITVHWYSYCKQLLPACLLNAAVLLPLPVTSLAQIISTTPTAAAPLTTCSPSCASLRTATSARSGSQNLIVREVYRVQHAVAMSIHNVADILMLFQALETKKRSKPK